MINVVALKITKVTLVSVALDRFDQSIQAAAAVVPMHTTLTRRYVVLVKSIARRADLIVVPTEYITLRYQCVAMVGYSINGVELPAVDHATITARVSYAATVELFPRCTVLHAVAQRLIVQTSMFVVITRFILVEMELDVAEVIVTKQANRFVVLAEFYPRAVVHHVVVP